MKHLNLLKTLENLALRPSLRTITTYNFTGNAAMADYLQLQGGTWHVRLAIPAEVRKAFGGRKILSKSLETGHRAEAMTLRLPYLTQWKAEINAAKAQSKAAKENWRPELASLSHALDKNIASRFLAASKRVPNERVEPPTTVDSEAQVIAEALLRLAGDMAEWEAYGVPGLAKLLEDLNILEACSPIQLAQKTATFKRELTARIAGTHYGLTPAEAAEAKGIVLDPQTYKPKSPITKPRLVAFRTAREEKKVSAKNVDQQESKLMKLSAFLAETGKTLDFDGVAAWLDSLAVTSKTKAQYINAGTTFWKWAMKYDARWREDFNGSVNPFEHHELPQARGREKADAQRMDFSLTELAKLHTTALDSGQQALADLILLGMYTGARIEEICQLRSEHVLDVDGILSFDITDSKTVAGIRIVPVHPALINLVQRLIAESSDGYLVPSTSRNKYGNRSDLHSKAFGRLKAALGFGPRHVFHSIRKTVITQLVRADVNGPLIAELVGHETGTITYDVYSQGASSAQKFAAISKLPTLTPP